MRHFSGRGGELFLASEATPFVALLEDAGDGFDWRAADPSLRHWLDRPLSFEVFEGGGWMLLEPLEVFHASGRVGFGRCLAGRSVRASGTCLLLSRLGSSESWDLNVEVAVRDRSSLGMVTPVSAAVVGRSAAELRGCLLEALYRPFLAVSEVLAVLPMALGAFIGLGSLSERGPGVVFVSFNEKGVSHASV